MKLGRSKPKLQSYCVLIPSKGRPKQLAKLFKRCPSLNSEHTYVGIEPNELGDYQDWWDRNSKVIWVPVINPGGTPSGARECLRSAAVEVGYQTYVRADDNCLFNDKALTNLVKAHQSFPRTNIMAGTRSLFDKWYEEAIRDELETHGGMRSFPTVSFVFWALPHYFYSQFRYPEFSTLDDTYAAFAFLKAGYRDFRVCLDASHSKPRHQEGGTGDPVERVKKTAQSVINIAEDFPEFIDPTMLRTRFPYKKIMKELGD